MKKIKFSQLQKFLRSSNNSGCGRTAKPPVPIDTPVVVTAPEDWGPIDKFIVTFKAIGWVTSTHPDRSHDRTYICRPLAYREGGVWVRTGQKE